MNSDIQESSISTFLYNICPSFLLLRVCCSILCGPNFEVQIQPLKFYCSKQVLTETGLVLLSIIFKTTMTCIFFFKIFRAQGDVYRLQSKLETSQSEADRLAMDLVKIQLII